MRTSCRVLVITYLAILVTGAPVIAQNGTQRAGESTWMSLATKLTPGACLEVTTLTSEVVSGRYRAASHTGFILEMRDRSGTMPGHGIKVPDRLIAFHEVQSLTYDGRLTIEHVRGLGLVGRHSITSTSHP